MKTVAAVIDPLTGDLKTGRHATHRWGGLDQQDRVAATNRSVGHREACGTSADHCNVYRSGHDRCRSWFICPVSSVCGSTVWAHGHLAVPRQQFNVATLTDFKGCCVGHLDRDQPVWHLHPVTPTRALELGVDDRGGAV